jgi:hypothetical protein
MGTGVAATGEAVWYELDRRIGCGCNGAESMVADSSCRAGSRPGWIINAARTSGLVIEPRSLLQPWFVGGFVFVPHILVFFLGGRILGWSTSFLRVSWEERSHHVVERADRRKSLRKISKISVHETRKMLLVLLSINRNRGYPEHSPAIRSMCPNYGLKEHRAHLGAVQQDVRTNNG